MRLNVPGPFRNIGSAISGKRRPMETAMDSMKVQRLAQLASQLTETLMTA